MSLAMFRRSCIVRGDGWLCGREMEKGLNRGEKKKVQGKLETKRKTQTGTREKIYDRWIRSGGGEQRE